MGRTKKAVSEPVSDNLDTTRLEEASVAVEQLSQLQSSYSDDRDLLNQLLGQAQMADAFAKFSRTVRTSKLAYIKENKLYQQLKGKSTPHGAEFSGTWEEFCGLLGFSVDTADRDIANLHAFGEEALESMSQMGIGYRELRQYRKLPEDEKSALIEVAKTGDKESFVELAEELISKHLKEKEVLQSRATEAEEELAASAKLLNQKNEAFDTLQRNFTKAQKRLAEVKPDEQAELLRNDLSNIVLYVQQQLRVSFRDGITQLNAIDASVNHDSMIAGLLSEIVQTVDEIRNEFSIGAVTTVRPEWAGE